MGLGAGLKKLNMCNKQHDATKSEKLPALQNRREGLILLKQNERTLFNAERGMCTKVRTYGPSALSDHGFEL